MTDTPADISAPARRRIVLLGSTGSIGTQAIDLVERNPDRFEVVGLSAGSNLELVARQAVALRVPVVAVASGTEQDDAAAGRCRGLSHPGILPQHRVRRSLPSPAAAHRA